MLLTKQDILGAKDLKREEVGVPEWAPEGVIPEEAKVLVRELNAREGELVSQWFREETKKDPRVQADPKLLNDENFRPSTMPFNYRARVCALGVINEDGTRMFSDAELEVLGERNNEPVNRVYEAIMRLSGIHGSTDALAGESEPGLGDASSSASA